MDLRRKANDLYVMVSSNIGGVSAINLEFSRSGGLVVTVSLDDLSLDMSDIKECVLDACGIQGIDPMGIYLDI